MNDLKDIPFDLAYTIQASTFRGERQLQIQWVDYRSIAEAPPETEGDHPSLEIIDLREEVNPQALLKSIQAENKVQIWAEGEAKSKIGGLDRNELSQGAVLVVWTTPPGPQEWQAVLELVQPKQIYLFAVDPRLEDAQTFLGRLAGLVKFALRSKSGKVDLNIFAAATAQPMATVRMGLLWMEAKGYIQVLRREQDNFYLSSGSGTKGSDVAEIIAELEAMLAETSAYRIYFQIAQDNLT